jgi:capsular polysaccharide biosynthesis protein
MYESSAAERLRALLLQAFLVGLVVVAGLLVFGTVADATTDVEEQLETSTP